MALQSNEHVDFTVVYREHFNFVWRNVRRFGVRERDQEDVVHDTFMALHRSWGRYDASRPLKPWIIGVAFRVVSDYRRRARFTREVPVDTEPGHGVAATQLDALDAVQKRVILSEALALLSQEQRALVVMHDLEGLSVPEIAEAIEAPLNTCYSRLRLGRERLRQYLSKTLDGRERKAS